MIFPTIYQHETNSLNLALQLYIDIYKPSIFIYICTIYLYHSNITFIFFAVTCILYQFYIFIYYEH